MTFQHAQNLPRYNRFTEGLLDKERNVRVYPEGGGGIKHNSFMLMFGDPETRVNFTLHYHDESSKHLKEVQIHGCSKIPDNEKKYITDLISDAIKHMADVEKSISIDQEKLKLNM